MNSAVLSPAEFWFYRVYSELTLSLLHQVNNELTGVAFLTELIRDDVEAGTPPGDKFSDLQSSVEKVIRLTQQTIETHLPIPSDMGESASGLDDLVQEGIPLLRLVLPKTIAIHMEPPPSAPAKISIVQKEFELLLAAMGVLLAPRIPRAPGQLAITIESSPAAVLFRPNYPIVGSASEATFHLESSPAYLALAHRAVRLGAKIELCKNPAEACPGALRLVFETAAP